jgi:hypothetical protein
MDRCVRGDAGGIEALAHKLEGFREQIVYDLLTLGHHLHDLGDTLSWWELGVILRQHPGAYAREYTRRADEAAAVEAHQLEQESKPVDQRHYGGAPLPLDELKTELGWT